MTTLEHRIVLGTRAHHGVRTVGQAIQVRARYLLAEAAMAERAIDGIERLLIPASTPAKDDA